jgi:hypothetical protein
MPCVDFKAIKAAVSIEDAANLLKLPLKKSGNQLRGNCPACGKKTTYPRYPTQTLTSLLRWRELLSEADPIGPHLRLFDCYLPAPPGPLARGNTS